MATKGEAKNLPSKDHNKTLYVDKELDHQIKQMSTKALKGYRGHARRHPRPQHKLMEKCVREFGIVMPFLVDADCNVIAGHLRLSVAKEIGYTAVPVIRVTHLSTEQVRAYRIADNRLAELGEWDSDALAREFQDLIDLDYDVELTAFEIPEIDLIIEDSFIVMNEHSADQIPEMCENQVSRPFDLWMLDEHLVFCGDACNNESYDGPLDGRVAQMVITDPPFNLRIQNNVSGLGATKHKEFLQASGEMSDEEYEAFLVAFVRCLVQFSESGSVHYLFIDWRHQHALERVCRKYFAKQMNLCVWVKSNGGMGSHYRSRHELVLVFKNGTSSHINNVQLGRFGRNRTNVWEYDGCSTPTRERREDLKLHPTVKPAEMIADAIRDSSHRGGLVLDPFLGSGTTVIACEMTGRVCAGMELDPLYVDVVVRRWEKFTGRIARHADTSMTFSEMADLRVSGQILLPPPATNGGM